MFSFTIKKKTSCITYI